MPLFLTEVEGLNQPQSATAAELLRLNKAIAVTGLEQQNNLGVIGGDVAGYPNGCRPGDDVVDITLGVAMGALIAEQTIAPNHAAQLTETAIALPVAIAGVSMFYPIFDHHRGLIAFIFGSIHGLGFASVLSELSLSTTQFYARLLGFNVGVEFGRLGIISGLLPVLCALSKRWLYRRLIIPGADASIAATGCIWVLGRALWHNRSGFGDNKIPALNKMLCPLRQHRTFVL